MVSSSKSIGCQHTSLDHFFSPLRCKHPSTLAKVMSIAFHVLTIGIVWGIYHGMKSCLSACRISKQSPNKTASLINMGKTEPVKEKGISKYSPQEQAALDFSRTKLSELNPAPYSFEYLKPPMNSEINQLVTLFNESLNRFFTAIETADSMDPWKAEGTLKLVDESIKLAFAISLLTLEDLPAFTEELKNKGSPRTPTKALIAQDSYLFRTYFLGTQVYHYARGELKWLPKTGWENQPGLGFLDEASKEHADLFYRQGTLHSEWRALYNGFCQRVREHFEEDDLDRADSRFVKWTRADIDPSKFRHTPDTLPT